MFRKSIMLLALAGCMDLHAQTISSDVGTTICKGTTVVMTTDGYNEWEVSTDGGNNWTSLGFANEPYTYATSSIENGYKYRVKTEQMFFNPDPEGYPPYEYRTSYSDVLTFTVNGERSGINTITDPARGSISFNGTDQAFQMSPGITVGTAAFTFEAWFRMDEAPWENGMFVLMGAGNSFKAVSVMVADPNTIRFDSWGYGKFDFTVPKMSVNTWYHLVMVRDASRSLAVFVNGTRSSTGVFTNTSDMTNNTGVIQYIGRFDGGHRFKGRISNLRMVTGSALYDPSQTTLTVPTSPLSSVTNTKVLLLANSDATKATDASGIQTLTTDFASPGWTANSPFRETVTSSRTLSNSVAGGTWSSSNPSVATVNASTGVVTPVANGNADITYSITTGGCTSSDVTPLAVSLPCVTNSWTGGTGNWNVAGNWSCGSVPDGSTDIAVSSGTPTLNVDFTLPLGRSLALSGTGSLIVAPGKTLTIAGTADFGGRPVTLKSTASGTASLGQMTGTVSNAGSVTVERYIPASRKWRFLTAPLTGASNNSVYRNWQNNGTPSGATGIDVWGPGGTATPSTGINGLQSGPYASMRRYGVGGTGGWSDVTDTKSATGATLFNGTTNNAFSVFVKGPFNDGNTAVSDGLAAVATTLSATGTPITGTHTKTLSANPSAGQYFLVGNPYASAVNPTLLSGNNLTNTFWMWDATTSGGSGAGSYVAFNRSPGTYNVTSGGFSNTPTLTHIQSGQAFFARASAAGTNTTITFEESDKSTATGGGMFGPQQVPDEYGTLRLTLGQTTGSDQPKNLDGAVAFFYANGNPKVDGMDGGKLLNGSENLFFRREGRSLTFEHRATVEAMDTLFVRMGNLQKTHYSLTVEGNGLGKGVECKLLDRLTGKTTSMEADGTRSYDFTVTDDSLSTGDRFMVLLARLSTQRQTPDGSSVGQGLRIHPNPARTSVRVHMGVDSEGTVLMQVFDPRGVELVRRNLDASGSALIDVTRMPPGLYTLLLTDAKGGKTMGRFLRE